MLLTSWFRTAGFDLDVRAIFGGVYPSIDFLENRECVGSNWKKDRPGLFDSTGTNISAVVYWNKNLERYETMANSKAQIPLQEEDFKIFFETADV